MGNPLHFGGNDRSVKAANNKSMSRVKEYKEKHWKILTEIGQVIENKDKAMENMLIS